jgi:hypothetical protein
VALAPKAPFIGPRGAFDGDPKWQSANTKSHPYLEYEGGIPPQRQPFAGVPAGALQEALNSSDDMKAILGIYDASLGARSNETSGRAIMARQREGDVSTFHFIDNLSRAIKYAGRCLIDLIPAVYDKPRMLRVLGEDGSVENVQVNGQPDEYGQVYELARGKYDLVVDTGPSFSSKREEMSQFLLEFMRSAPQAGPLVMDMVAKSMDFPESDKIARRFQSMLPPQIQQMESQGEKADSPEVLMQQLLQAQGQLQQMGQQMQQMQQALETEQVKAQADLQAEREKTQMQIQAEIEKSRIKAQSEIQKAQMDIEGDIASERIRADSAIRQARIGAVAARNETTLAVLRGKRPKPVVPQ